MYADVREQVKVEGRLAERYAEAYIAQCRAEAAARYQAPEPVKVQEQPVTTQYRWYQMPMNYPVMDVHHTEFNILVYLQEFEKHVVRYGAHPEQYIMLLRQLVDERDTSVWEFIGNQLGKPWDVAKKTIAERYKRQSVKTVALKKLNLAYQGEMSIERYADGYLQLLAQAEVKDDEHACAGFTQSLNDECKNILTYSAMMVGDSRSVRETRERLSRFFQKRASYGTSKEVEGPTFKKRELQEKAVRMEVDGEVSGGQASKRMAEVRNSRTCFVCKKPGHYKSECPLRKNKSAGGIAKSSSGAINKVKRSSYSAMRVCAKETLDECAYDERSSVSRIVNELYETDCGKNKSVYMVTNYSSGKNGKEVSIGPYLIPVLLNGIRVMGMLDTGADVSILSKRMTQLLGLKLNPSKERFCLAADGMRVESSGKVTGVQLCCGTASLVIDIHVFELGKDTDFLIGRDLDAKLGIRYCNIPTTFPDQGPNLNKSDLCGYSLDSCKEFFELKTKSGFSKRLEFEIQSEITENLKTYGKFCSVKEAVVNLDTGSNQPLFINQYQVKRADRETVDRQVKKWFDNGVTMLSEVGATWNSSLLVVPKKDLSGMMTGKRVCLDARPLNNVIPDDKHPLPKIRDIFEMVSGHRIFSKLDLAESYHQFPLNIDDRVKTSFYWGGVH